MRVIAGTARRLQLVTPPGMDTRPTADKYKETLFNILQPEIAGCRFLDLFAGSGGIGIEALSRGAARACFVENGKKALQCIEQNLQHTHLADRAVVMPTDVMAALSRLEREKPYDIIFMDPPYGKDWPRRILGSLSTSRILTEDSIVIVEETLDADFSWLPETGFTEYRRKEYKTNQHVFLRREERG